jgi:hypothetical protein
LEELVLLLDAAEGLFHLIHCGPLWSLKGQERPTGRKKNCEAPGVRNMDGRILLGSTLH